MKLESRSLDKLVEEQLSKWQARKTAKTKATTEETPKPVITISIDPGSGGVEIAKRIASLLGMDLLGSEIIQRIAESAQMSKRAVETLDEKETRKLNIWLDSLFGEHFSPDEYFRHLTNVIGTIGKLGNTILLGRGAQYILPHETTFRLRIIAPLDIRIEKAMQATGHTRKEAEDFVLKMQKARRSFVKQYFQRDVTDPLDYDMVINTENLSIDAAVLIIQTAIKARFPEM
jgi:cytidylate kinase